MTCYTNITNGFKSMNDSPRIALFKEKYKADTEM